MNPFVVARCLCLSLAITAGNVAVGTPAVAALPAPEFTWWRALDIRDLDGAQVPATKRWIVLAFLDPDCPVANAYFPVLNSLARSRDKDCLVIGVYTDPALPAQRLRGHGEEFSIRFPTVVDRAQRLVHLAGATYASEVAILDGEGSVLYLGRIDNRVGTDGTTRPQATQHDLSAVLDRLIAGETGPFPSQQGFGCTLPDLTRQP